MKKEVFHDKLKRLIHEYVMLTYKSTKLYPNDEKYGLQSQDRRAAVSVMLNYVEGYARMRIAVKQNQYEIAFGSMKESIYCRFLAYSLKYISHEEYTKALTLGDEISAMLYSTLEGIKEKLEKEQTS